MKRQRKKQVNKMKLSEIREKSVEELKAEVIELKKQLFDIRFKKSTHKYENMADFSRATSDMKKIKKTIARMKTVIEEKLMLTK